MSTCWICSKIIIDHNSSLKEKTAAKISESGDWKSMMTLS